MKLLVVLFALFVACSFGQTICGRYTSASINASALVTYAVNKTFSQVLQNQLLLQFFNGSVGQNFLTNPTAYQNLFNGVVYFFEQTLGCSDASVVAYNGPNMTAAHQGLGINFAEFSAFNNIVANVLSGAGFLDNDTAAVAFALGDLGNGIICTASDCNNICNRYCIPYVLNNSYLISLVVNRTVTLVLQTGLAIFFNGTVGQNFLTNPSAFNTLFDHLVQFFGNALGCTDGSIGPYAGQNLTAAHAGLGITVDQFNQFNNILLGVLQDLQVSYDDINAISGVLNQTQSQIVSGGSSSGTSGSSAASGSSSASGSSGSSAKTSGSSGASGSSGSSGSSAKTSSSSSSSSTGSAISLYVAMIALLLSILI